MNESVKPAPGQVWEDNDWRARGRTLRIDSVDETHATCTILTTGAHGPKTGVNIGRQTRIMLRRFKPNSTGYRYLRDGGPE